ncbi:MAG TPA: MFS transporter, partial [Micropepsaceae bacterium]|nr:MFS transporter [Micropepsaceae bacterium]
APASSRRPLVLVCIMLSLFMSAIEVTIVATVLPQIVGKLGGFALYSWIAAGFLLTQTATTVIFGKLSDIYGRKPIIIGGTILFLIGSALCGLAWSMTSLIAFRLLQGIGAGSMQPVAVTIAGDIYTPRERLRVQAALSGVWALAAIIGPFAGGLLVEKLSWSWVFWVNIPVGILTVLGFIFLMHEDIAHKKHAIDYLGASLFSIAVGAFMIALTQGATLTAGQIVAFVAVSGAGTWLFLIVERQAKEPMIALDLWSDKLLASANGALLFGMMALAGITLYLPLYFQGVLGYSPLLAGFPLSVMLVSWPLASAVSGRILRHFSMRSTLRFGGMLIPVGAVFLLFLGPGTNIVVAGIGPALMGFGMGLLNIVSVIMVQGSVQWSKRGSATASLLFSRTLGNTLGAAALGAILNFGVVLYAKVQGTSEAATPEHVRALLTSIGDIAGGGAEPALQTVLNQALHLAFWAMLAFSFVAAALSLLVPVKELESLSSGVQTEQA